MADGSPTIAETVDAYDRAMRLSVNGAVFPRSALTADLAGRVVVTGPEMLGGLVVTRRCFVPETVGEGYACFLEYLENHGDAPIEADVAIFGDLGADQGQRVIATSSGDATFTLEDRWLTSDDGGPGGASHDPSLSFNFWGAGAGVTPDAVAFPVAPSLSEAPYSVSYPVVVPAHAGVLLMHFAGQRANADQAAALANAQYLDGLPAPALAGLAAAPAAPIVNWSLAGDLGATPETPFAAEGLEHDVFAPDEVSYVLTNTGLAPLDWAVTGAPAWLDVTPSSGTLAPGGTVEVAVSLVSGVAQALAPGLHYENLLFENTTTGGACVRGAALRVFPQLNLAPPTGLLAQGRAGGPFAPDTASYALTNAGPDGVAWSVEAPAWLMAAPASGSLAPGETVAVTLSVNANAETLPVGAHVGEILFQNVTLGSAQALPAELRVREVIYVDGSAPGPRDGASWAHAYATVQEGVDAAAAAPGPLRPWVWTAEGVYHERVVMADGVEVYGGFAPGAAALADRVPGANVSVLDGGNAGTVVTFGAIAGAGLDGFTARNGFSEEHGGGVSVQGAAATCFVRNCVVRENKCVSRGAGIYLGPESPIEITGCTIIGNIGMGSGDFGGGVMCDRAANARISDCVIAANRNRYGGGLGCIMSSPTVVNCVISGNEAATWAMNGTTRHGSGGGGVFAHDCASPTLVNCLISGNYTVNWCAGALYCQGYSNPRLINCTLSRNRSHHTDNWEISSGVVVNTNSKPSLTNCIIEGMWSEGIREEDTTSDVAVNHCLFRNNGWADFVDEGATGLTGGHDINRHVADCQDNVLGNPDPLFVMGPSGAWTEPPAYDAARNVTVLTTSGAPFVPGALAGRLINPDTSQPRQAYVMDNTAAAVEVLGDVTSATGPDGYVDAGDGFLVVDYHVGSGSPAGDAGDTAAAAGVSTDLGGGPRVLGGAVDLGVFEQDSGPRFSLHPAGAVRYRTTACTLSARAESAGRAVAYQWLKGGADIPGATDADLVIPSLAPADAGVYACRATDDHDLSAVSNPARIEIIDAPPVTITRQPAAANRYRGQSHVFDMAAEGGLGTLHYEWRANGAVVPGATTSSLALGPLAVGDSGAYVCRVYDVTAADWTAYGGHFYRLTPSAMTWPEAEAWARALGGHLAAVTSDAENAFLFGQFGGGDLWIGLSDPTMENEWTWANGEPTAYTNWGDGEPNHAAGIEWCAQMRGDGKWNDLAETQALRGVVEIGSLGVSTQEANLVVRDALPITIVTQPAGAIKNVGDAHALSVVAENGYGPLSYAWTKDGAPLPGQTDAAWSITPITPADAGSYACIVSDADASVTSDSAVLDVRTGAALALDGQPAGATKYRGETHAFTVSVAPGGGVGVIHYQWTKDGATPVGGDAPQLALGPLTLADAGDYACQVWDDVTNLSSASATLEVRDALPPVVSAHPAGAVKYRTQSHTLLVAAEGGLGALHFQWTKDGADVPGATTPSLTLEPLDLPDAAAYACRVHDDVPTTVVSDAALLEVLDAVPLAVTAHPASLTCYRGASYPAAVTVQGGFGHINYLWTRDGAPAGLPNAAAFNIPSLTPAHGGAYQCVASDAHSSAASNLGAVLVYDALPPEIALQPAAATRYRTESHTFAVQVANGYGTIHYQWTKDGADVPGATTAALTLPDLTLADAADYACRIRDDFPTTRTSNAAALTVINAEPVRISGQPLGAVKYRGESHRFAVAAEGGLGALTYAWHRDNVGKDLDKAETPVPGADEPELLFENLQPGDSGAYRCAITDQVPTTLFTSPAVLVVADGERIRITQQPAPAAIQLGEGCVLSVMAEGGVGALHYGWLRNGDAIAGAPDAPTHTIADAVPENEGFYACEVSDDYSAEVSDEAFVDVIESHGLPVAGAPACALLALLAAVAGATRIRRAGRR